jgi:hypothetical protein
MADAAPHETIALPQEAATSAALVTPDMAPDAQAMAAPTISAAPLPGLGDHEDLAAAPSSAAPDTVASAVQPLLDAVEPLANNDVDGGMVYAVSSIIGTVEGVTPAVTQILPTVTHQLSAVTQVLPEVTQTLPAVTEALPAVTQTLEAVTVPSLQGAGLDALAGLLQPAAASPAAAQAPAGGALGALDHVLMFAPIGVDDPSHHTDAGIGHALHAALPAAGSGLI